MKNGDKVIHNKPCRISETGVTIPAFPLMATVIDVLKDGQIKIQYDDGDETCIVSQTDLTILDAV